MGLNYWKLKPHTYLQDLCEKHHGTKEADKNAACEVRAQQFVHLQSVELAEWWTPNSVFNAIPVSQVLGKALFQSFQSCTVLRQSRCVRSIQKGWLVVFLGMAGSIMWDVPTAEQEMINRIWAADHPNPGNFCSPQGNTGYDQPEIVQRRIR